MSDDEILTVLDQVNLAARLGNWDVAYHRFHDAWAIESARTRIHLLYNQQAFHCFATRGYRLWYARTRPRT